MSDLYEMPMPLHGGYGAVTDRAARTRCLASLLYSMTPAYDDTDRERCHHCGEPRLPGDVYCAGCGCQIDWDQYVC